MSNLIKERSEQTLTLKAELAELDFANPAALTRADEISKQISENDAVIAAESRRQELLAATAPALSKGDKRDLGRVDLGKILRHLVSGDSLGTRPLDGVEAEMVQEGEAERRSAGILESSGIMLPRVLVRRAPERRALQVGTPSAGGHLVPEDLERGILDDFFAGSVMHQAGATVLEGLQGNITIPRILTDSTKPGWKAELAAADEQNPSFAVLTLTPKRQTAYVDISEQLLMQSGQVVEAALRRNLSGQIGELCEAGFFHGTGALAPNGLLGTAGIASVAGGTNGAQISLKTLVELESAVDAQNALGGSLCYLSNGAVRGALKQTPLFSSTDSRRLLESNAGEVNGYAAHFTNVIRRDLTKGNKSTCSALIFGNVADYTIGHWSGLSLSLERGRENAIHGRYTLVVSVYVDGGVVRPKSFAACTDVLTA